MADAKQNREFLNRDARQGEIILQTRWRRIVFAAGLAGIALLVVLATGTE